jgi:hypothetical protein
MACKRKYSFLFNCKNKSKIYLFVILNNYADLNNSSFSCNKLTLYEYSCV